MKKKKTATRKLSAPMKVMITILLMISLFSFLFATILRFKGIDSIPSLIPNINNSANSDKDDNSSTNGQPSNKWILPESAKAEYEYVAETLFIGDSNTARFMQYIDEEGRQYSTASNTIAVAGMSVESIKSLECMQFSNGTYNIPNAVSILQPRRIIMTYGTNNLGHANFTTDNFISIYLDAIKAVKDAYPYSDIIINSIPPVTIYTKYTNVDNNQIREFNSAIIRMCEENELYYLDSHDALLDEAGEYGNSNYFDTDGLHLNEKGVNALFSYIRTHALETNDRRPKPLNEIPYIIGPITDLLTINPLDNEPFEETPAEKAEEIEVTEEQSEEVIVPQEEQNNEEVIAEEPAQEGQVEQEPIQEEQVVQEPIQEEQVIENPIVEEQPPTEVIVEEENQENN